MSIIKKKGLLIINLGSPTHLSEEAVRDFLDVFLSDPNVIDKDPVQWRPVLDKILETRPKKSLERYKKIWTDKGSPIIYYTKSLADKLEKRLPQIVVGQALSYGEPSIKSQLDLMMDSKVSDLYILPLFPQHAISTIRTIWDQVADYFSKSVRIPRVTFSSYYFDQPGFVDLIADSVEKAYRKTKFDALVCSYHGVPKARTQQGDPRQYQCEETTTLIASKLGIDIPVYTGYQSIFGDDPYLEPFLPDLLTQLIKDGVKRVGVVAPSFAVECLETLEEVNIDNRSHFLNNGGEEFVYVPCLNDSDEFVEFIASLVD